MLISVIIPVYNVERYLRECLDSVLSQSYRSLEVILVDDGSLDGSPRICDEYAAQDPRVRVIHQRNGGASVARNAGLRISSGEYTIFIDGDDYWADKNCIASAVEVLTKHPKIDLLCYDFSYLTPRGITTKTPYDTSRINGKTKVEALSYLISADKFMVATCSKFVRRDIITQNNITLKEGVRSEDYDWTLQIVIHSKVIYAMDSNFYVYRLWDGSVSANISTKHLFDIWGIITDWHGKIPTLVGNKEEAELYFDILGYIYGVLMSLLYRCSDPKSRQELISQMQSYTHLLKHTRSPKVKKVARLYNLLGFNLTWRALWAFNFLRSRL